MPSPKSNFQSFWGRQSLKTPCLCAIVLCCRVGESSCAEPVVEKKWGEKIVGVQRRWAALWVNEFQMIRMERECSFLFHVIQIILHEQTSSAGPGWTTPVFIILKGFTIIHGIIGNFLAFSLRTYSVSMFSLSWRKNPHGLRNNQWACQHIITTWRSPLHCRHKKSTSTPSTHQEDALKIFLKKYLPSGKKQRARVLL